MADKKNESPIPPDETVLVAYVTVHLASGESFELLPFEDTQDVKAKVRDLVADWARTGFLIRGNRILPWHQVRHLEGIRVEEIPVREAELRRKEWNARDTEILQKSFWRTKHPREQKKEEEGDQKGPRAAA